MSDVLYQFICLWTVADMYPFFLFLVSYVVKCCVSFIGMETGLMFNCDLCSFRSVRKDNYLAHVAEHKNGSYPNNRHRKRNSSKLQVSSAVRCLLLRIMCV